MLRVRHTKNIYKTVGEEEASDRCKDVSRCGTLNPLLALSLCFRRLVEDGGLINVSLACLCSTQATCESATETWINRWNMEALILKAKTDIVSLGVYAMEVFRILCRLLFNLTMFLKAHTAKSCIPLFIPQHVIILNCSWLYLVTFQQIKPAIPF